MCSSFQIENVDDPVPEKSPQIISTTTGSVHKRSRKGNSPAMVCALTSSILVLDLMKPLATV